MAARGGNSVGLGVRCPVMMIFRNSLTAWYLWEMSKRGVLRTGGSGAKMVGGVTNLDLDRGAFFSSMGESFWYHTSYEHAGKNIKGKNGQADY